MVDKKTLAKNLKFFINILPLLFTNKNQNKKYFSTIKHPNKKTFK